MKTKIIALDVYGTFLYTEDYDNCMCPREGFSELVRKCQDNDIIIVTSSDTDTTFLNADLEESLGRIKLTPNVFDTYYWLRTNPKDYSKIIEDYKIKPEELFVIGDREDKDLAWPIEHGCSTRLVPNFGDKGEYFDLSTIEIP